MHHLLFPAISMNLQHPERESVSLEGLQNILDLGELAPAGRAWRLQEKKPQLDPPFALAVGRIHLDFRCNLQPGVCGIQREYQFCTHLKPPLQLSRPTSACDRKRS